MLRTQGRPHASVGEGTELRQKPQRGEATLASMHFLRAGEAERQAALEEIAVPTTRCVAPPGWRRRESQGSKRGTTGKGGAHSPGPRTPCLSSPVPGFQVLAFTLGPCPPMSPHVMPQPPRPQPVSQEGGKRPPKHRRPGWELPLSQGLVPWPQ